MEENKAEKKKPEKTLSRRLRDAFHSFINRAGPGVLITGYPDASTRDLVKAHEMLRLSRQRNLVAENTNAFFEPANPRRTLVLKAPTFSTTQIANLLAVNLTAMTVIYLALLLHSNRPMFESAQQQGEDLYSDSSTPTSPRPGQSHGERK